MNFLESIGALTLVGGAFYSLLKYWDNQDKKIRFFRWILDNDSTAREEFTQNIVDSNLECRTMSIIKLFKSFLQRRNWKK